MLYCTVETALLPFSHHKRENTGPPSDAAEDPLLETKGFKDKGTSTIGAGSSVGNISFSIKIC